MQKIELPPSVSDILGSVKNDMFTEDCSQKPGYKVTEGELISRNSMAIAGHGEVTRENKTYQYIETIERWEGGVRLIRRYTDGSVYIEASRGDIGVNCVSASLTMEKGLVHVHARYDLRAALSKDVLPPNTPRSREFINLLPNPNVDSRIINNGNVLPVTESMVIENGVESRKVEVLLNLGPTGESGRSAQHEAMAMTYNFIKGGAVNGNHIAHIESGFWKSPGGIYDNIARCNAMKRQ